MRAAISLLFDNASHPHGARLAFEHPLREIRADTPKAVDDAFAALDDAIAAGHWVAGYLSYELGAGLEPKLAGLVRADAGPLIRMFVFDRPRRAALPVARETAQATVHDAQSHWPAYQDAFAQAQRYILDGDIYQVNLTFPLAVTVAGDTHDLYARLRTEAKAGASALLNLGDETILSFSPETFFVRRGSQITARPMKGTAARGLTAAQDLQAKRALRADPKERAENLMIVDLLRNDLSRIATPGSVHVTDLFTVETFPRLHTMTSGVAATLCPEVTLSEILRALYPCGSITGAPKIRAMEIIHSLERAPRGPYCGAIGFAGPDFAAFNVAIRTLTLRDGRGTFPVGSGVVADSHVTREFQECLLKARFLNQSTAAPSLIETVGWTRAGGAMLAAEHDERLADSAAYFGYPLSPIVVAAAAAQAAQDADADHVRVRLVLRPDGGVSASGTALPPPVDNPVWRYAIANARIQSRDPARHHKTTDRAIYDDALADARARGLDEVIFLNERDEVAEGAISTIFLDLAGTIMTPPLTSGALNGCLRRAAFDLWPELCERVVTREMLAQADSVWFGNSVRGFVRGVLAG